MCARVACLAWSRGPSTSPLDGARMAAADALAAALRIALGGLIGVIFALCLAAGLYVGWQGALTVICVGAAVGAYLGLRYGNRFFVWVLKFWNQPGD